MSTDFTGIARHISRISRMMRIYYDKGLEEHKIGWGQQFMLEYINEHPGLTPQDVTDRFQVDKGTTAKALKKLMEVGYLLMETDKTDKRVRHLYLSEAAAPVVAKAKALHGQLREVFIQGLSEEQLKKTEKILEILGDNLKKELWPEK